MFVVHVKYILHHICIYITYYRYRLRFSGPTHYCNIVSLKSKWLSSTNIFATNLLDVSTAVMIMLLQQTEREICIILIEGVSGILQKCWRRYSKPTLLIVCGTNTCPCVNIPGCFSMIAVSSMTLKIFLRHSYISAIKLHVPRYVWMWSIYLVCIKEFTTNHIVLSYQRSKFQLA